MMELTLDFERFAAMPKIRGCFIDNKGSCLLVALLECLGFEVTQPLIAMLRHPVTGEDIGPRNAFDRITGSLGLSISNHRVTRLVDDGADQEALELLAPLIHHFCPDADLSRVRMPE